MAPNKVTRHRAPVLCENQQERETFHYRLYQTQTLNTAPHGPTLGLSHILCSYQGQRERLAGLLEGPMYRARRNHSKQERLMYGTTRERQRQI